MKVREVMSRDVECVSSGSSIREAAQKMASLEVGSLPVTDGNRLLGIVTDRDIVVRAVAEGKGGDASVDDVMTSDVVWCEPDHSVEDVARKMSDHQIRRIYVLDSEELCGVVALGDLATEARGDEAGDALRAISKSEAIVG